MGIAMSHKLFYAHIDIQSSYAYDNSSLYRFLCFHVLTADALWPLPVADLFTSSYPFIGLDELRRTVELHCQLVAMDEYPGLCLEEPVNVFQSTICCLWVEEVGDGDEREADDCPDDPELVAKTFDAGKRGLHDCIIADPVPEWDVRK
jgi:hypothetical protein